MDDAEHAAFLKFIETLQVGERVIETSLNAYYLRQGDVCLGRQGDICVKWDAAPGETGRMTTSITWGTRRVKEVPADY